MGMKSIKQIRRSIAETISMELALAATIDRRAMLYNRKVAKSLRVASKPAPAPLPLSALHESVRQFFAFAG